MQAKLPIAADIEELFIEKETKRNKDDAQHKPDEEPRTEAIESLEPSVGPERRIGSVLKSTVLVAAGSTELLDAAEHRRYLNE